MWVVKEELGAWTRRSESHVAGEIELVSGQALYDAKMAFFESFETLGPYAVPFPADFPEPVLKLPAADFAPDFFTLENWKFVSAKLIAAMALPSKIVDLRPARVVEGSSAARARRYHLMHIHTFEDIIDYEASDCETHRFRATRTGEMVRGVDWMARIRFKPDVPPPADLFGDRVDPVLTFATDDLAARVLAAGCTGIEFQHPLWFSEIGVRVVRTPAGVEKHVYAADDQSYDIKPIGWDAADAGPATPATRGVADYILPARLDS